VHSIRGHRTLHESSKFAQAPCSGSKCRSIYAPDKAEDNGLGWAGWTPGKSNMPRYVRYTRLVSLPTPPTPGNLSQDVTWRHPAFLRIKSLTGKLLTTFTGDTSIVTVEVAILIWLTQRPLGRAVAREWGWPSSGAEL